MSKVNINEKLAQITDQWNPRVVGEINGQQIRLVKIQGNDFELHDHPDEEMFFVVKGNLTLEFEQNSIDLNAGDFYIVPRNTLHRPVCESEVELMMFVSAENINTGNVQNEFTLNSNKLEKL